MVTAELAVAIPSVVLVLALCLVAAKAGVDQIRCVDAARVASRAAARGDDTGRVRALAAAAAPDGATVQIDGVGGGVGGGPGGGAGGSVRVTISVRTGGWGALPGWDLTASAVTPVEAAS